MPVDFVILPRRNLVLFRYHGEVTMQEVTDIVAEATSHPSHCDGMSQLCDLSRVTGIEKDFAALMKMQAKLTENFAVQQSDRLVVFYAPTPLARSIAQMAKRSWDGLNAVVVLMHEDEAEALALLGVAEKRLSDLQAYAL